MGDTPGLVSTHQHWQGLKITALRFPDGRVVRAGSQVMSPDHGDHGYCESITAYSELGDMGATIWFDIKVEWASNWRVNSAHVERVEYARAHEADK